MRIVVEGPGWLVVDKPAGLLSTPGRQVHDSVVARLERQGSSAFAVHRLDLDTSGLLVVATDPEAHRALSVQFQRRTVHKSYMARVSRRLDTESGRIALAFRLDPQRRPYQVFDPVHGRLGITEFQVVGRGADWSRVRFWPRTGRTHQLRLHAAHPLGLGAPIMGDPLYGAAGERLALDADRLSFHCPKTGRRRHIRRPPTV